MKSNISSAMKKPVIPIPQNLPVGFRFEPTDTQLIGYYLMMLLSGFYSRDMPIGFVNFWDLDPWELPGRSRIVSDNQVWYFFCQRVLYADRKRRMFNRKTPSGHWKSTSESTFIDDVGKRSTLRFYKDSPKEEMTEWKAYEYEITQNSTLSNPGEYVIIKLVISPGEKRTKLNAVKSPGEKRTKLKGKMSKLKREEMSTSTCAQNQSHNHEVVPFDFEYQNTEETSAISHFFTEPRPQGTSGYQSHSSVTEVREYGSFSMTVYPNNIPGNQKENVQSNSLSVPDPENQRLPSEVEDSAPKATPSTEILPTVDETYSSCSEAWMLEDHIVNGELDLSVLEDDLCSLIDFDVDNEANVLFPEVDAGVLAEMEAFNELQYCVNHAVQ